MRPECYRGPSLDDKKIPLKKAPHTHTQSFVVFASAKKKFVNFTSPSFTE